MKIEKQKAISVFKKICASLWYLAIVLLFIILVSVFAAKMSGKVPSIFGYSVVRIITPSMEDRIPVGTYILLEKVDAEEVKKGDIICFYSTDPQIYGMPNTHMVASDPIYTDTGIEFETRGTNNPNNDDYRAKGDRLVGRYVCKLGVITAISSFFEGRGSVIFVISLTLASVVMMLISLIKLKDSFKEQPPEKEEPQVEMTEDLLRFIEERLAEARNAGQMQNISETCEEKQQNLTGSQKNSQESDINSENTPEVLEKNSETPKETQ